MNAKESVSGWDFRIRPEVQLHDRLNEMTSSEVCELVDIINLRLGVFRCTCLFICPCILYDMTRRWVLRSQKQTRSVVTSHPQQSTGCGLVFPNILYILFYHHRHNDDELAVNECVRHAVGGCISPFFEQRAEEQVRHIEVSRCELTQPGKKNINRCSFHQCF